MSVLRTFITLLSCCCLLPDASGQSLRFGDPLQLQLPALVPGDHDPAIPAPESVLGQAVGTRLARHDEIVELWRAWAETSERVTLRQMGATHEGRPILSAIITSPANHARLHTIRADLQMLVAGEGLSDARAEDVLDRLPAVAWLGYSIHGDETSGADAGLVVGHHLAASTDPAVAMLLDTLVVVVDPCMNPDGRTRLVGMVEQLTGYVPSFDHAAMQRGRWPWGRGNHYLFDMNRDWLVGTQPETRARWAAARDLPPQLFVDAHEMGGLDSFLFYPQNTPHNPWLPAQLDHWHRRFARDAAAAFDSRGWSYYSREWADGWGPFYSDAWGSLSGAVGILYEQARTSGYPLRNAQGVVLTYREAVDHQVTASLANLATAAANRRELLSAFREHFVTALNPETPGNHRMLALVPGRNASRERQLVNLLLAQGIQLWQLDDHLQVSNAVDGLGQSEVSLDLPPGTVLVPARQSYGALARNALAFDVRIDDETLLKERRDLLKTGITNLYDATAWSLPLLADAEAWWCDLVPGAGRPMTALPSPRGGLEAGTGAAVAWIVDGADDASVAFAARAMERQLVLAVADEAFESGGLSFARGSVLVRAADNGGDPADAVRAAAEEAGVTAYATGSGLAPGDGADLGGGHFGLLHRPRVAMLSGDQVEPDAFGHLWHTLDTQVGLPVSFLDASFLGYADLRQYNVLVLPPGSPVSQLSEALQPWVAAGGTLIAVGDAAGQVAASDLSQVARRRDVLDELDSWTLAARREQAARDASVDLAALFGDGPVDGLSPARAVTAVAPPAEADQQVEGDDSDDAETPAKDTSTDEATDPMVDTDASRQDQWLRRFSPAGVLLRGLVDEDSRR